MRCISLWQPWASAIAVGAKRIETRSWSTRHRGPIAIHAAKRTDELNHIWYGCRQQYRALRAPFESDRTVFENFPLGAIIAVANLVDCVPVECLYDTVALHAIRHANEEYDLEPHKVACQPQWTEEDFGDYSPGRFGWILDEVRQLPNPIPYRGRQRIFEIPDEVLKQ